MRVRASGIWGTEGPSQFRGKKRAGLDVPFERSGDTPDRIWTRCVLYLQEERGRTAPEVLRGFRPRPIHPRGASHLRDEATLNYLSERRSEERERTFDT